MIPEVATKPERGTKYRLLLFSQREFHRRICRRNEKHRRDDAAMTSQGWIFDPPPPPPPKRTAEAHEDRLGSGVGRGGHRGGGPERRGRYPVSAKGTYRGRQQNVPVPTFQAQQQVFPQMAYGMPYAGFQRPIPYVGVRQAYPHLYSPYAAEHYPAPTLAQTTQPPSPHATARGTVPKPQIQNPDHTGRRLPVYSTPTTSKSYTKPSRKLHAEKNALGYSMSTTAYSLPEHHVIPIPAERPEMSEEELRYALEMQVKEKKMAP
jgi:hypothetical protein